MPADKTLFGSETDVINLVKGAPGVRHLGLAADVIQKATKHLFVSDQVSVILDWLP